MSRFTTMLLAAAVAAIAATAAVALPAIGSSDDAGTDKGPNVTHLAACLAGHGLPGAPANAAALKQWLAGKADQDPRAVKTAIDACQPRGHGAPAAGPDPTMIACLRRHGLDAPRGPRDFKRWVGEQQGRRSKTLDDALVACKMALARHDRADGAGKPPAAKRDKRGVRSAATAR